MHGILDKILLLKCNCWKWKIKVEIKINRQYMKGATIFVFHNFYYIHNLFYEQSIVDPRPEYCLSFSKKLPQKIV